MTANVRFRRAALAAAAALALAQTACQTTGAGGGATGGTPQAAPGDRATIVGHRGAAGLKPENTLAAVQAGLAHGADAVEIDVQLSRDGVPVVYHDLRLKPALTRGADGDWLNAPGPAIRELSARALGRYDVGRLDPDSDYAERYPDQQPADGARVPHLRQVLDAVRAAGDADVWIELKTDPTDSASTDPVRLAEAVHAALKATEMTGRAKVMSFDWRGLDQIQSLAPDLPTVYLTAQFDSFDTLQRGRAGPSPWTGGVDLDAHDSVAAAVAAAGGDWWAPHHRRASGSRLDAAEAAGLQVAVWTLDDPDRARRLVARGVDAVITDRPDRMRADAGS